MAKTFTKDNFEAEVINAELPVFVDFWAPWCGPCQSMGPVIDNLALDYEGKVIVGKLDVNIPDHQELAIKYGIKGIPAFKIFKGGEVVAEFVGSRSIDELKAEIDKVV